MSPTTRKTLAHRPAAEMRMPSDARQAWRDMERQRVLEQRAREVADEAQKRLFELHAATEQRFGREIPCDAFLIDVLACIEIIEGDRWRWLSMRNNHNVPTVRVPRDENRRNMGERSVARFLGLAFGVITEEDFGTFYPAEGDADDLNPWHRTMRGSSATVGNPARFLFKRPQEIEGSE